MFGAQHFAYDILRHVILLIFTTYGYVLTDDPNKPLAIAFQTGELVADRVEDTAVALYKLTSCLSFFLRQIKE